MSNKKGISQFQAQLTCAVITGQYAIHIVPFSKVTQLMYPSLSCCFLSRQTVKSQLNADNLYDSKVSIITYDLLLYTVSLHFITLLLVVKSNT